MLERLLNALFGRTSTQERDAGDVDALVENYRSPESTKQLLEFGRALLTANDERVEALDTKVTMIVGYSTAILAFMITRVAGRSSARPYGGSFYGCWPGFALRSPASAPAWLFAPLATGEPWARRRGFQRTSKLSEMLTSSVDGT
jgi:hypothetical protein